MFEEVEEEDCSASLSMYLYTNYLADKQPKTQLMLWMFITAGTSE